MTDSSRSGLAGAVGHIAGANVKRFIRNRSFFVLAIIAPLAIMTALSATIGSALSGSFRPELVIANEIGESDLDDLISGLREAGFNDLEIVSSATEARRRVEDGGASAALVYTSSLATSLSDPTSGPGSILVIADAEADISAEVAEAIAQQSARSFDTVRSLSLLSAPLDDLSGPLAVSEETAGLRVLTDGTYFAVGMTSYFSFFAASALVASIHLERRESTLDRMLVAPIHRIAPLLGKGLASGSVAFFSFTVLVIASTVMLGSDWGPPVGVVSIALALCFAAVGISMAIVSVTSTEESAGQIGAVVATAWAIFGGVFLPLPPTGLMAQAARLSPFKWVVDGIGLNAGAGSLSEVLAHAGALSLFGFIGFGIAYLRRNHVGVA